jgi:hypothetical protein
MQDLSQFVIPFLRNAEKPVSGLLARTIGAHELTASSTISTLWPVMAA